MDSARGGGHREHGPRLRGGKVKRLEAFRPVPEVEGNDKSGRNDSA